MSTSQKRQRLTPKQRDFLYHVYALGFSITDTLNSLNVRTVTFERWLTRPVFLDRLRMYITQYYLQARLEMARSAPAAISGLTMLSQKSLRHEDVRKACNDILNFQTQFAKIATSSKMAQHGAPLDNFGALLAQFGASLAQNGACLDTANDTNTPKNGLLGTKNNENTNIHLPSA